MSNGQGTIAWNDGLVSPALDIAQTTDSPLRVLAGPGTGKTFSMMRRVARLLQEGTDPSLILVCTFTRTAATDLKKSLAKLGTEGADQVNAFTIHSYCFSLLHKAQVMETTRRIPRPLLDYEVCFLLEDVKGGQFGGIHECKRRLKAFDAAWARLQSDDPGWPQDAVDQAFHTTLIAWLRFHKAMLIGELVVESLAYLKNNPESPYRGIFDHVLVDEYQDLNRADQILIDYVAEAGALTVIGDENQSIYSFRFANPEGVTEFAEDHPGTHDELLVGCRRCPRVVVEIANSLIQNNRSRTDRPITYMPGNPQGELHIIQWTSMYREAGGIARYIKYMIDSGKARAGNILVLSPRRQFGYLVRGFLEREGVPAHSFFHEEQLEGDPREMNESSAQQAFSLLTLLSDPGDYVATRCWCGFGSSSLNKNTWKRIREHIENSGDSLGDTLESLRTGDLMIPYSKPVVERYKLLRSRLNELGGLTGQDLVNALFPESEEWSAALRSLGTTLRGDDTNATALLDHLRVNITQPELPTDVDYVRVMSLHKSKGLTADLVVVLGCMEGLIPTLDDRAPQTEQDRMLEEQRRLFYVAITRAKEILVLSSVTNLPRNLAYKIGAKVGSGVRTHVSTIASRFIPELGPTCPTPVRGVEFLRNLVD